MTASSFLLASFLLSYSLPFPFIARAVALARQQIVNSSQGLVALRVINIFSLCVGTRVIHRGSSYRSLGGFFTALPSLETGCCKQIPCQSPARAHYSQSHQQI